MASVSESTRTDVAWQPAAERVFCLVVSTNALARQLRRVLGQLGASWGLSDSEILILWRCSLRRDNGIVQGDLAGELDISAAQMSALVDRLRERNLLVFERSALDRRRQVWRLSTVAEGLLQEVNAAATKLADGLDRHLGAYEQQQAESLNQQLLEALQGGDAQLPTLSISDRTQRGAA